MGAVSRQLWTCSTSAREVLEPAAVLIPGGLPNHGRTAATESRVRSSCAASLTVRCVTFNMNSCPPLDAVARLQLLGDDHARNDMIIVGSQESGPDVQLWHSRLMTTAGADWHSVASDILLGINIVVMANSRTQQRLSGVQTCRVATGIGNLLGNKGAVAVRLTLDRCAQLLFVCCHLAAHADQVAARNTGYHRIVAGLFHDKQAISPRPSFEVESVGGSNARPEMPLVRPESPAKDALTAYDVVIMLGDLNYRVDLDMGAVTAALQTSEYAALLAKDQLQQVQAMGSAFQGFQESEITFAPTFKLYPNSAAYNLARTPSYTDRILWRQTAQQSRVSCKSTSYDSLVSIDMSDHRPVTATFNLHVARPLHADQLKQRLTTA